MSAPLTNAMQTLLDKKVHRFAVLWEIVRTDGVTLRFTDHDTEIQIGPNTYLPSGGFDASARRNEEGLRLKNLELVGVITNDAITHDDLRGGRYREAEVFEMIVDSRYPWAGVYMTNKYWIAETKFNGETWETKVEGLVRWINPQVGKIFSRTCNNDLGDEICRVNLAATKESGTVFIISQGGIASRTNFEAVGLTQPDDFFTYGRLTWTSGLNVNLTNQVKVYKQSPQITIELMIPTPFNIAVNDTFDIESGCDKLVDTCKNKFNNFVNFRGFPFIPGTDAALEVPRPK